MRGSAWVLAVLAALPAAAAELELYGTIHSMGVIVSLTAGEDPDENAAAVTAYRTSGGAWRAGFPLSRVSPTRMAGSLFFLEPGTSYEVSVTFQDPGGALDGTSVSGTAATRPEPGVPAPSAVHHASPDGSGTDCSPGAPCALATAIARAQPGEAVYLHAGLYSEGEIDLPRSGAPGAPIVIAGEPGGASILSGLDPAAHAWTAEGGGIYSTTVAAPDTHLVLADGQRLYPYQSLADLQNLVWGIPGFHAEGTSVRVHLAGDADPNQHAVRISRFNHAFRVERDHIVFQHLTLAGYGCGSYAKAIYFTGASDNLVQRCVFSVNDLSIGIKYDSHRNLIQDCEFSDTVFDWPWDAVKNGSELETGGIRCYSPASGRGTVIRRNVFHDYFDGFGVSPEEAGAATNETDVYENLVYRAGDDGLEADGTASNVRIWGNTFRDVLMGISLAPVYDGPVYAIRNLIYRTGAGNSDYTGSPFKLNSGYDASGPIFLFHNTADAVLAENNGLYIKAPGEWRALVARNNVWAGTAYAIENTNTSQPADLDYDLLWTEQGDLARWDGVRYASLAEFSTATGQESHGQAAPPAFAAPAAGDYAPAAGSPLIDAGLAIPGVNDAYAGAAPDIGAFESGGPAATPTPLPPCSETGVDLAMPADHFEPGDPCRLDALVCNTGIEPLAGQPLIVVLDVYGSYFFGPSWQSQTIDFYDFTYPNGVTQVSIVPAFTWPAGAGAAAGIVFWGALTDPSFTQTVGRTARWEFGYSEGRH